MTKGVMSLEYWYMFPVSIAIATIAMASAVEGGTFFAPVFILALGLPPEIAIGTALITEVFGFSSGLSAYMRMRLIDYRLGITLLVVTIPMALIGTWAVEYINAEILKVILGVGLVAVAASFLRSPKKEDVELIDAAIEQKYKDDPERCLVSVQNEKICYTVCNKKEGMIISGIGAMFMGMISTGLGEMNGYFLLQRCRVPSKVSVATGVFVVAMTALIASSGHFVRFAHEGGDVMMTVLSLVIFTVPGVIIGGQIGSRVASRISQHALEFSLAILFILVAILMLGDVIF